MTMFIVFQPGGCLAVIFPEFSSDLAGLGSGHLPQPNAPETPTVLTRSQRSFLTLSNNLVRDNHARKLGLCIRIDFCSISANLCPRRLNVGGQIEGG